MMTSSRWLVSRTRGFSPAQVEVDVGARLAFRSHLPLRRPLRLVVVDDVPTVAVALEHVCFVVARGGRSVVTDNTEEAVRERKLASLKVALESLCDVTGTKLVACKEDLLRCLLFLFKIKNNFSISRSNIQIAIDFLSYSTKQIYTSKILNCI